MSSSNTSFMHRPVDMLFAIFFSLHLFPAFVFAPQVALSPELRDLWIPQTVKDLLVNAVGSSHDPLLGMALGGRQMWMASIFTVETVLQGPFFIYAIIALSMNWTASFRIPAIIYSVHVLTTMIPISAELLWGCQDAFMPGHPSYPGFETTPEAQWDMRMHWMACYAPFVIMPAILLVRNVFFFNSHGSAGGAPFAYAPGSIAKVGRSTKSE
ncbi:hypothetical protein BASA60_001795 [Batrachochytrium salamandrivorans]|nr:hypothetical protein BASA62_007473 [Batrachochytrium salamandrivorans]KAH6582733.1 hypothetical protein BASA60_001795 [Batrachochytrium salamandrivorans]KAH9268644.1 hypothetical protein BASA83_009278 [Batrachochytrium salamandrivorans]